MDKARRKFLDLSSAMLVSATLLKPCAAAQPDSESGEFLHGVASGDPLADQVIIWTRITPAAQPSFIQVRFEVARDIDFLVPLQSGLVRAYPERDYTIKIDLLGLQQNTIYYYRFSTPSAVSPVGRTRTLPTQSDAFTLAVFSCANYTGGYFNVYHDACRHQQKIDAVIHLGDYLYEYGMRDSHEQPAYATEHAKAAGRELPAGNDTELFSLSDYRKRYALYRSDPDLQRIHSLYPFICIWDDHEIADNTYQTDTTLSSSQQEADRFIRKKAALQAYYEWLPIRMPVDRSSDKIYRSFHFGTLFSLYMLDSRLGGRTRALDYHDYILADGSIQLDKFVADVENHSRQLLGSEQFNWLQAELKNSSAQWQVIAQQVRVSQNLIPAEIIQLALRYRTQNRAQKTHSRAQILQAFEKASQIKARMELNDSSLRAEEIQRLEPMLPYNLDAWDGYSKARRQLYQLLKTVDRGVLLLSGDAHYAWSNRLVDDTETTVGIELGVTSVSAPGIEEDYDIDDPAQLLQMEQASPLFNKHSIYTNLRDRGYLILQLGRAEVRAHWRYVNNISSRHYQTIPQRNHLLRIAYHNGRYYYR